MADLGAPDLPDLAPYREVWAAADSSLSLIMFDTAVPSLANCRVLSEPSSGVPIESLLEFGLSVPPGTPSNVRAWSSALVTLPTGEAGRWDYEWAHESDGGAVTVRHHSLYMLDDLETVHYLTCSDVLPRRDRWLSIAETFEFLPAEE
jgi:hypothetical protein